MYGIPLYIVQILMNFQNLCLNLVILEGGSFSFLKKTASNQVNFEKMRNIGSKLKNNMSQLQRRGGEVNKN